MIHRKDALVAAADVMLKIREHIISYGNPVVITTGMLTVSPGTKNIIPGEVNFSIDMRHHDDTGLTALEKEVRAIIESVCKEYDVPVKIERYWRMDPVHFDERVIKAVAKAANKLGLKSKEIVSGAGHDAVYISSIIPTGMLFVPSIDGRSHCPQENTKWKDIVTGTEALTEVLVELDK
jgi:hydantoinase/carbamoylase family amidase